MEIIFKKVLEPEVLAQIMIGFNLFLYVIGRITKKQLIAEQMKSKQGLKKEKAKDFVAEASLGVIHSALDTLDKVPVLNTKLPLIKLSVPSIAKLVAKAGAGGLSDFIFNFPGLGANVNK